MQQLTGMDQLFLGLDATGTTNCTVGALTVFQAPEPGAPVPDEAFMRERLAERIKHIPPFHMVRVRTPLGIDHDYLAEAEHVDIAAHVSTIRLAKPGTQRQFEAMLGELMELPLDHDRPMWDLFIIEGLEGGAVAHLLRFSHGVVDGSLMTRVYNLLADDPGDLEDPDPERAEPPHGWVEMLGRGMVNMALRPARFASLQLAGTAWMIGRLPEDGLWTMPALMARMVPGELGKPLTGLINLRQRARGRQEITPYFPTVCAPRIAINGHLSAHRQVALLELSLDDVKVVTHAMNTTLNNVLVAVVAGAMRRYLIDRDMLPRRPLVVCVPVSLRTGEEKEEWANYVHMINAPLPTNLADPLERLHAVIAELRLAKGSFDGMPTHLMRESSRLSWRDGFGLMSTLMARTPNILTFPQVNVTVSNVRGPEQINKLNGLPVRGYFPISFLTPGGGVNISLWSYQDKLCFGLIGAPEQVKDLAPLARDLEESLAELVEAAREYQSAGRVVAALSVPS